MPDRFVSDRFVGRERELSRLAVALEAAALGRSPRILLSGTGGIGVSRLVSETIRRVERLAGAFRVVRCRAVPTHGTAAYASIAAGVGGWLESSARGPSRLPGCCPRSRHASASARNGWVRGGATRSRPSAGPRG